MYVFEKDTHVMPLVFITITIKIIRHNSPRLPQNFLCHHHSVSPFSHLQKQKPFSFSLSLSQLTDMRSADEEWVKAAMTDDSMVVELLVRLNHAEPRPPPSKEAVLALEWSVRQRRSKSISVNKNLKKPAHRASPTTPLSWSGATSFSGGVAGAGGVGSEESSRPIHFKLSNATRSKVNVNGGKTTSKRSRKKTLAELKVEENSLLKERRELKRKMAALCMNLERQRATNENLKRMKIELQPRLDRESILVVEESTSSQLKQELPVCHFIPPIKPPDVSVNDVALQSSEEHGDAASDHKFILPDLNIPFDEPSPDVICGLR